MAYGPQRLFHSELVLKFSEVNYECAAVQRHCLYTYLYSQESVYMGSYWRFSAGDIGHNAIPPFGLNTEYPHSWRQPSPAAVNDRSLKSVLTGWER